MASRGSGSKFVIQPFKHNQQMDEDYANRTWQTLHDAIRYAWRTPERPRLADAGVRRLLGATVDLPLPRSRLLRRMRLRAPHSVL